MNTEAAWCVYYLITVSTLKTFRLYLDETETEYDISYILREYTQIQEKPKV